MRTVEIGEAKGSLSDYAREAQREALVVTRRGKPVAAVVPIRGMDMETLSLSTNPDFIALIERSRARHKAGGGISLEEVRRKYGLGTKPRRRATRKLARKRPSSRP